MGGEIIGLDTSKEMVYQFRKNCAGFPNAKVIYKRIDQELDYRMYFDKAFISFVLHGFPQNARIQIIRNAFKSLEKKWGILYTWIIMNHLLKKCLFMQVFFKAFECPYALDFIEKDWNKFFVQ